MKRSHQGIAYREGGEARAIVTRPIGHAAQPDSRRQACVECGRAIHYRRKSYGPNGKKGGWAHTGDGLAQWRSWR